MMESANHLDVSDYQTELVDTEFYAVYGEVALHAEMQGNL
jgi:hypothetical protein